MSPGAKPVAVKDFSFLFASCTIWTMMPRVVSRMNVRCTHSPGTNMLMGEVPLTKTSCAV